MIDLETIDKVYLYPGSTDLRKGIAFYKDDILNKITSNFLRNSTK